MSTAAKAIAPTIEPDTPVIRGPLWLAVPPKPHWSKRLLHAFTHGALTLSVSNGKSESGYFKAQWPALALMAVILVAWWNTHSTARDREMTVATQMATVSAQINALDKLLTERNEVIRDLKKELDITKEDVKVTQDTLQQLRVETAKYGRTQDGP